MQNRVKRGNLHIPKSREEFYESKSVQLEKHLQVEYAKKCGFGIIVIECNTEGIGNDYQIKHIDEVSIKIKISLFIN